MKMRPARYSVRAASINLIPEDKMGIKKPVQITETVLRDAHQSLIATRMTTEEMLPAVPMLECWMRSATVP